MSAFHTIELSCPCGHKFKHTVARGINIQRKPELRELILNGSFHRVTCEKCKQNNIVEAAFSYADPERKMFVQVKPRKHFFNWKAASNALEQKVNLLPVNAPGRKPELRVVYGLAELREKILAQNAGLDDRMIEIIKVKLLYEHPFLLKRPRLQFILTSVDNGELLFRASHLHDKRHFQIVVPDGQVRKVKSQLNSIRTKVKSRLSENNLFDPTQGHFVSYQRYMPQTDALAQLAKYAQDIRANKEIQFSSKDFKRMIDKLPRGAHLSSSAKNHLKQLQLHARKRKNEKAQAELWEVRFGKDTESEFWKNDSAKDIDSLWKVFEELPDDHIEGNNRIKEVTLFDYDESWGYYVAEDNEIEIHSKLASRRADFEDTLRHEVGHGVHQENSKKVNDWLESRFGWKSFPVSQQGLDSWLKEMGEFEGLSKSERADLLACFEEAFDGKNDCPGKVRRRNAKHVWSRTKFRPKIAYEESPEDWYSNCRYYCRSSDKKKAFFLNYTYRRFYVVNSSTIDMIYNMPSNYAAVSESEFFAELYSFHFDTNNSKRHKLPADVKKWLNAL